MKLRYLIAGLSCIAVTACSSVIEGTSQEIAINTNPSGADCSFERQGLSIARINSTPGAATIKKSKYAINIICHKMGYKDASFMNSSDSAGAAYGNIIFGLLGGPIGWAVDSASGADNKYESTINITMTPLPAEVSAK